MKTLTIKKGKLTELLSGGLLFVSVEDKVDFNDKSKILHNVTALSIDCNETITITCNEGLSKDFKQMDKIDFANCEVTFKGKGTSAFGTNIMAELVMNVVCDKAIKVQ